MVHTPELQAYTASKLYNALRADISQEALTLSATWVLGEYSELLVEGGLVDDEQTTPVWVENDDFLIISDLSAGVGNRRRDHRSHSFHP